MVFSHVGHVIQPVPHLVLHICKISKLPQGPEVLSYILDRVFHLALFIWRPDSTGPRGNRKFTQKIVSKVLLELQEEGFLSNSRFIEVWVSSRLRRHYEGFRSLYAGLVKAGISSEEARNYLIPYLEELDMDEMLSLAAEKIMKKSNISRDKLIRTLIKRGFEYSSIIKLIEQRFSELN